MRLRYDEAPTFLDLTQVIFGYQAQQNVTGNFNLYPRNNLSIYIGGAGSLKLQESPTFTYAPISGEQLAAIFSARCRRRPFCRWRSAAYRVMSCSTWWSS